jgi:hypothetical protein
MPTSSLPFRRRPSAFLRGPVLGLLFLLALGADRLAAVRVETLTAATTWRSSTTLPNRAEYVAQGVASPLGNYVYVLWKWNTVGAVVQQSSPEGVWKMTFGPPYINQASAIAADAVRGDVYVLNSSLKTIVKFTYLGALSKSFGGGGTDNGQFINPVCLAVGRNRCVYVADARNCDVQKFSSEGVFQHRWKLEAGGGRLLSPNAIAVGPNDEIYVLGGQISAPANNVLVYTDSGTYLRGWNSKTPDRTAGYTPVAIAVNGLGTVLISDISTTAGAVQEFSPRGEYERAITVMVNGKAFYFDAMAFYHDDFVYAGLSQTMCKFRLF